MIAAMYCRIHLLKLELRKLVEQQLQRMMALLLGAVLVGCVRGCRVPAPRMLTTKGRDFVNAAGDVVLLGGTDVVVKVTNISTYFVASGILALPSTRGFCARICVGIVGLLVVAPRPASRPAGAHAAHVVPRLLRPMLLYLSMSTGPALAAFDGWHRRVLGSLVHQLHLLHLYGGGRDPHHQDHGLEFHPAWCGESN